MDGRRQFNRGKSSLELEFSSTTPKRFTVDGATYDRSGRLTIDTFAIDRMDDVSDPMLDYFASAGGVIGGGLRGMGVLGDKPYAVTPELNEWFRFDKPGVYALSVTSRRASDDSVTPAAIVPVESNTVSFEILPRDPGWEASELDAARRIADARDPSSSDARHGCRMMRFLGTTAAVQEMVRRTRRKPVADAISVWRASSARQTGRHGAGDGRGLRAAEQPRPPDTCARSRRCRSIFSIPSSGRRRRAKRKGASRPAAG